MDGKQVKVIDIHGHIVIPKAQEVLAGTSLKGRFPANQDMAKSAQARLDRMDRRGIDMQVLSINDYWWYAADRDLAAKIVRVHDEGVSDWCKRAFRPLRRPDLTRAPASRSGGRTA